MNGDDRLVEKRMADGYEREPGHASGDAHFIDPDRLRFPYHIPFFSDAAWNVWMTWDEPKQITADDRSDVDDKPAETWRDRPPML